MQKKSRAAIVGSGVAGLATAVRLASQGYDVTVFEANEYAGGKLAEIRLGDFRFDAGPSLFTLPDQMEAIFAVAGKRAADYFSYKKLDIVCRYFYEDGTMLNAWADTEQFAQELQEKMGIQPESVRQFFERSADLYRLTKHVFLEKSLHKLSTYLNKDTLASMLQVHRLDAFRTMHAANAATFSDPRLVQLFDRYATYNGSNPYTAPATLNIIPHLEYSIGAYFPDEGMAAIPRSLQRLAEDVGVKFRFSAPVSEILVENGQAKGVISQGETFAADVVISNMDIVPTYRKLMPRIAAPEKTLSQPRSSSALIFYWAMDAQFPELDLHNIFFSKEYRQEFDALWQQNTVSDDVTVYVFVSSKIVPTDAPPTGENWFVLINAPANDGSQDWDALTARLREATLTKLERMLNRTVRQHIVAEDVLDPRSIEARTSSYQGALYGSSSNNRFAAFLRHPNFSQQIKNLYFCGGSVHPGGGIPLCLLSAKIVSDLVGGK